MPDAPSAAPAVADLIRRHLRAGWAGLFLFAGLGFGLEALHAFKLGFYLDVGNESRRLLWTLAHAHGVLLSLVQIAFAATLHLLEPVVERWPARVSLLLLGALVLLPAGFFAGGFGVQGGDPGPGVALAPLGGVLLLVALAAAWSGVHRSGS